MTVHSVAFQPIVTVEADLIPGVPGEDRLDPATVKVDTDWFACLCDDHPELLDHELVPYSDALDALLFGVRDAITSWDARPAEFDSDLEFAALEAYEKLINMIRPFFFDRPQPEEG